MEIMVSKGNHPHMALIQVSEILYIICPDIIQHPGVPTGREVSPVVRQSLLHWAYELTLKDFREKQPAILAGGSHWTGKDNKNIYPLVN